ncbi:hypothetical protein TKK_0006512 [Trichogramma kaykai]|uniref:Dynein heavy chain tail domain-containing protein n=1 Tax=Trichogramma kaykai TaxID=54128 RepID=A0ABD2XCG4_9HYME
MNGETRATSADRQSGGKSNRLRSTSEKSSTELHRDYLDMDTDEEEFGRQETPETENDEPIEPDKPVYTSQEIDQLLSRIKDLTILPKLRPTAWNPDCREIVERYFRDPAHELLTIYLRRGALRALVDAYPREPTDSGLCYFARREPWQIFRPESFVGQVQFGCLTDRRLDMAILRLAEATFAPLAFKSPAWPDVKRDEIFSRINDFLETAVDATYRPLGIPVLYQSWEAANAREDSLDVVEAQKRPALLLRLDRVARNWIKRVREQLKLQPVKLLQQSSSSAGEDQLYDVINEFEYWHTRFENLSCLLRQLRGAGVRKTTRLLRRIRSTCIDDLRCLRRRCKLALAETEDNLAYLDALLKHCTTLDDPGRLLASLATILHIVRFVWTESSYYSETSNVERLLCSVSVYVVRVCVNSVDAKLIVDRPLDSAKSIEACLACCRDYRVIYDNIISGCIENESREWKVDKAVVFNCVEAFEQRCEDLLDICQTIVIYGSLNKINLGGTRGRRHEAQYNHIRDYFMRVVEETRQACASCALDVRRTDWFPVAVSFRARIADLEKTMRTLLLGLFGDGDDVEPAIETLYALQRFRDRKTFSCLLQDKWTQVWAMFDREIAMPPVDASLYDEIPADRFRLPRQDELRDPEIIRRNYLKRLHRMMIDASDWLGDCDAQHEVLAKYSATV